MKKGLFSLTILVVLILLGADARSQGVRRPIRSGRGAVVARPSSGQRQVVRRAPVARRRLLPRVNLFRRGR